MYVCCSFCHLFPSGSAITISHIVWPFICHAALKMLDMTSSWRAQKLSARKSILMSSRESVLIEGGIVFNNFLSVSFLFESWKITLTSTLICSHIKEKFALKNKRHRCYFDARTQSPSSHRKIARQRRKKLKLKLGNLFYGVSLSYWRFFQDFLGKF